MAQFKALSENIPVIIRRLSLNIHTILCNQVTETRKCDKVMFCRHIHTLVPLKTKLGACVCKRFSTEDANQA